MPEALRDDCAQRAVGVSEHEQPVGPLLAQQRLRPLDDLTDARAEAGAVHMQLTIWRAYAELFEEDVAQAGVVVLPGMDEDVIDGLVEPLDHAAEPDDLGAGTEDREDLHTWKEGSSCTRSPLRRSSSSTPARSSRSSPELYSGPSNGTRSSSPARNSGRIGPTAR